MVKVPPQAIEVEESVLGAMMIDPDALEVALENLDRDMFYKPAHGHIYEAVVSVRGAGDACDILSVEQELRDKLLLDTIGGAGYLSDLTRSVSSVDSIEYHIQILREKKILRSAILSCGEIIKNAYSGHDAYEVIDDMSRISGELEEGSVNSYSLTPSQIQERDKGKEKAEKLYLGLSDLDMGIYADGNRRGQVELTIADSGHGKTQYGLFKAEYLLRQGRKIAWFQLEGYDSETSDHILNSGVRDFDNMFICDSLYDIEHIKREARRLNRVHGIDYIVFDYVQNIECSQKISKTEKVEYISKEITKMAKELNVLCHPLSQITMDKTRMGWRCEPKYDDVRWSQQLKQDASVITSVFRPSRIESLVLSDRYVKDWNDRQVPYNSVFVKQAKVRHGQQEWKRLHMIHTDKGLKPYAKTEMQPANDLYEPPF